MTVRELESEIRSAWKQVQSVNQSLGDTAPERAMKGNPAAVIAYLEEGGITREFQSGVQEGQDGSVEEGVSDGGEQEPVEDSIICA
jgi:hypothetical protein